MDNYTTALPVTATNGSLTKTSGNVLQLPDANNGYTGNTVSLTTTAQSGITFRLYIYGAEGTSGTGGLQGDLAFAGTLSASSPSPAINPSVPNLSAFSTTAGTASTGQTFTVTGSNIASNVTVTSPAGFEISSDGLNFSTSLILVPTGSSLSGTLSVRIAATTAAGSPSGNIAFLISGVTQATVSVSGTVTSPPSSSSQTINFPIWSGTPTYGDGTIALQATATSGLTVAYVSSNLGVATISGSTLTIVGPGTSTITATQSGNSSYTAAVPVEKNLIVAVKNLTVSGITANAKTYDASSGIVLSGTPILSGVVLGDTVTVSGGEANCADASAGVNRPVTVSGYFLGGSASGKYTLSQPNGLTATISRRPLTVIANHAAKNSGSMDPTLTYSISGLLETNGLTGTLARTVGEASGAYPIGQGSLAASDNYNLVFQSGTFTITTPYNPPATFYNAASGKVSTDLKASLNTISKSNFRSIPYGTGSSTGISGIVPVLNLLYEDPANPNNIILIYGGQSIAKTAFGTSGSTIWNREHCWPQSFGAASGYAQSDLFHMRPVIGSVNSDRGNDVYGYVSSNTGAKTAPACRELENLVWEPPDNEKGQIARGILYMAVRYEGTGDNGTANLELIEAASDATAGANQFGKLSDILAWNRLFPPTEKEKWINNEIYTKYQLNRNPFIDNPDYAEMVFKGIPSVSVSLSQNAAETGLSAGKIVLTRAGPTTGSLTVNFSWGGSATPGTDTSTLGTSATFVAGVSSVDISVPPLADSVIEGTEVLTLTLAASANYVSSVNQATVSIVDAPVATGKTDQTITFPAFALSSTYGDPALTLGATASSGLSVSYTSLNTSVATVSGNVVTLRGVGMATLVASQAGNGSFNPALSIERILTVEPKAVSISGVLAANKPYDGTTLATLTGLPVVTGVIGSDAVSLGSSGALFETKDVGTGKAVVTGYILSGVDAWKYRVNQPTGLSAAVTVAGLTVSGAAVQSKPYDGTMLATLTGGTLVGVFGEDDVTLASNPTGTFASKEVGTWNVETSFSLLGIDQSNYLLSQPSGITGTITAGATLAGWASGYGLSGSRAMATTDPDGDGKSNAAEFALGGNPIVADGDLVKVLSATGGNLKISFWERSGVIYTVRSATNLGVGFTGTVGATVSTDQSSKPSADYTRYEATFAPIEGKGFLKVEAVVP